MDSIKDPFAIFPEKVWELIIDNLEDSRDIQNVFAAFPKLGECKWLQRKKAFWLFDQAILFLATWDDSLDWDDLKSLRQTCKRWSLGVDKILQEDLNLDNYIDEDKPHQTVCYWEGSDHRSVSCSRFQYCHSFNSLEAISQFVVEIGSHVVTGRNPFLTRAVGIEYSDQFEEVNVDKCASKLLESFGVHIWYFKFVINLNFNPGHFHFNSQLHIYKLLVKCLNHLPNLRSLEVFGSETTMQGAVGGKQYEQLRRLDLPELPYLKTFRFECNSFGAGVLLLEKRLRAKYSPQILRSNDVAHLDVRFYSHYLYPNLKELELDTRRGRFFEDVFQNYKFPPLLTKLQLKEGTLQFDMARIFSLLKKIPLIKYLDLKDCFWARVVETENFSIADNSVHSLQFLKIPDSYKLSYNFLLCFPSLRQLVIVADVKPLVVDNSANSVVKIREQISTGRMYDSNVWELFGELKGICMIAERRPDEEEDEDEPEGNGVVDSRRFYQFRRETYERLKENGRGAPFCNRVEYHPLRQDSIEFLKLNAGQGAI